MFTKCMTLGKVNLFDRCELQVKNGTIFPSMDSDTNFSSSLSSFFLSNVARFYTCDCGALLFTEFIRDSAALTKKNVNLCENLCSSVAVLFISVDYTKVKFSRFSNFPDF